MFLAGTVPVALAMLGLLISQRDPSRTFALAMGTPSVLMAAWLVTTWVADRLKAAYPEPRPPLALAGPATC